MRFADAKDIVPPPRVIAGTELRPFCLGHHLLFKALGLPFAGNHEADAGPEDIFVGIAVCGLSYDETLSAIHRGTWPDTLARWRKRVSGPWWNPRLLDYDEIEAQFREHLADGYSMPPTWRYDGKNGLELTTPWELLLKSRLVQAGYSEAEVINGYLPARWYDYFADIEIKAADTCADLKMWRKVFVTQKDAEALK